MRLSRSTVRPFLLALMALGIALFCAPEVRAEPASFSATVGGAARTATVDAFQDNGKAYLPLNALVQQLGGSVRQTPGRLQIDIGGRSAVITLDGTGVNTARESFSLRNPVREGAGGGYIAVEDLEQFFQRGVGVGIAPAAAIPTPAPEETPAPPAPPAAPNDMEEEMGLLEEVKPQAPAAAPEIPPAPVQEAPAEAPAAPPSDAPAESPPPAPKTGQFTAVIDAGHGGADSGILTGGGAVEKAITLAIALKVRELLAADTSLQIVLTRAEDRDVSPGERVNIAQGGGTLFVSIHAGGSLAPGATGFALFFQGANSAAGRSTGGRWSAESRVIAGLLEQGLREETGLPSRGLREAPLRVLSEVDMAAVLVEVGMLTNAAEEQLINSTAFQDKAARGIARAIKAAAQRHAGAKP